MRAAGGGGYSDTQSWACRGTVVGARTARKAFGAPELSAEAFGAQQGQLHTLCTPRRLLCVCTGSRGTTVHSPRRCAVHVQLSSSRCSESPRRRAQPHQEPAPPPPRSTKI